MFSKDVLSRFTFLKSKFASRNSPDVSDFTILSAHSLTLITFLFFLIVNVNELEISFKRLKKIKNFPPLFNSTLNIQVKPSQNSASLFKVCIKYDFEKLTPHFSDENENCDLLEFLENINKCIDIDLKF